MNDQKELTEAGTYSTYWNREDIQIVEKLGLTGMGPAHALSELSKMAEKYQDNKKKRDQKIRDLREKLNKYKDMNAV